MRKTYGGHLTPPVPSEFPVEQLQYFFATHVSPSREQLKSDDFKVTTSFVALGRWRGADKEPIQKTRRFDPPGTMAFEVQGGLTSSSYAVFVQSAAPAQKRRPQEIWHLLRRS